MEAAYKMHIIHKQNVAVSQYANLDMHICIYYHDGNIFGDMLQLESSQCTICYPWGW